MITFFKENFKLFLPQKIWFCSNGESILISLGTLFVSFKLYAYCNWRKPMNWSKTPLLKSAAIILGFLFLGEKSNFMFDEQFVKDFNLFGSLRLGVQEDLEELRREEEELKRKRQSKKLRTR